MVIVCPHCNHRLSLKTAKTGRFRPKCPGCQQPFLLIVPDDPDGQAEARAILDDTIFVPPRSGLVLGVEVDPPATAAKQPSHHAAGLEDTQIPGSLPNLEIPNAAPRRGPSGTQHAPAARVAPASNPAVGTAPAARTTAPPPPAPVAFVRKRQSRPEPPATRSRRPASPSLGCPRPPPPPTAFVRKWQKRPEPPGACTGLQDLSE